MKTKVNSHQLNHLVQYIIDNFDTYGPKEVDGKLTFGKIESPQSLDLSGKKTPLTFKKILQPNMIDAQEVFSNQKLAFLALPNCDVTALKILIDQLPEGLKLKRENILILGVDCRPDKFCFCDKFENSDYTGDFYLEASKGNYYLYGKSLLAKMILNKTGIKYSKDDFKQGKSAKPYNFKAIRNFIDDKTDKIEFWQKISDQCFGCGACSAACPICYCTRQETINNQDGSCQKCLGWDSCFAKRFSEIQNNFDLRPENADRIYNWYHHKFVRATEVLCTGCGRCIAACPANLNVNKILESIEIKNEE